MADAAHWDDVYARRGDTVSWHEDLPEISLDLIGKAGIELGDTVLDVGAGASRLADALLAQGHRSLVLVDISARGLEATRTRLGAAASVEFIVGDVLDVELPVVALWHDRALFHFLGTPAERARYVRKAAASVRDEGFLIVATFGEEGPEECSDLPVTRYSPKALAAEFASHFVLRAEREVVHVTPDGREQEFSFCLLQRQEQGDGEEGGA